MGGAVSDLCMSRDKTLPLRLADLSPEEAYLLKKL